MNKPYAVFLDIDGTLYVHGAVPEENITAIRDARRMGHFVFINTARSHAAIPDSLMRAISVDGIVAGIGTDLHLGSEQLFLHTLTIGQLKEITARLMLYTDERDVVYEGVDYNLRFRPEYKRDRTFTLRSPKEFDGIYRNAKICKMFVKDGLTPDEFDYFSKEYTVFTHRTYSEFVPKGFSKAQGMLKMLRAINVPVERCICMGDSANDADMLAAAGISVAMGDAIPEIKQMCDHVSADAADAGVGKAIRELIPGMKS
ncbi:MAG: Cof-type HAD-IIB family hydrolase [Clostridia bacterium]|nr:Cof-type HAD-IIB family hydrolase [Clostridia bacterium]